MNLISVKGTPWNFHIFGPWIDVLFIPIESKCLSAAPERLMSLPSKSTLLSDTTRAVTFGLSANSRIAPTGIFIELKLNNSWSP